MAESQPPSVPPSQWGEGYGAIILAAGMSSRMGANKLLLPWRDGLPIVRHVAAKFGSACQGKVFVVTGRDADLTRAALAGLDATCVHNPDYATGEMLSSLKAGLRALPGGLRAVFIQPADMPCLSLDVIAELAAAHEAGWTVAPRYRGRRGHPVLLDRTGWGAMLGLPAGAAPRAGLAAERLRLVDVEDAGVLLDVDTRAAYERALETGC